MSALGHAMFFARYRRRRLYVHGEIAFLRNRQQRDPVIGGIGLRGGLWRGRDHRCQIQRLSGRRVHLRRIHQPVPAHPHLVICLRQIGQQILPVIVGDHDLAEFGLQVAGLRDHPHAGFRAFRTRHRAADIFGIHRYGVRRRAFSWSSLQARHHCEKRRAKNQASGHGKHCKFRVQFHRVSLSRAEDILFEKVSRILIGRRPTLHLQQLPAFSATPDLPTCKPGR